MCFCLPPGSLTVRPSKVPFPIGKDRLPTTIFRGRAVKFWWCSRRVVGLKCVSAGAGWLRNPCTYAFNVVQGTGQRWLQGWLWWLDTTWCDDIDLYFHIYILEIEDNRRIPLVHSSMKWRSFVTIKCSAKHHFITGTPWIEQKKSKCPVLIGRRCWRFIS